MITLRSTIEEIMLAETDRRWELHRGRLREKPAMTEPHNLVEVRLQRQIWSQVDADVHDVRANVGRVQHGNLTYYIPDVFVVRRATPPTVRSGSRALEVFAEPLPFVAEVWSPSTGDYDVDGKLPEYIARGDQEIWRLHPYEFTVTIWLRLLDGTYTRSEFSGGTVELHAIPGVIVDIDALFA